MSLKILNKEELDSIQYYATLLFTPNQIADILEVDRNDFISAFKSDEQEIKSLFNKGCLIAQVKVREKLFNLAYDGSNTAITEFLKLLDQLNKNLAKL